MSEQKKVYKFWVGYNVGKIEKWLAKEEENGWNLVNISSTGVGFTFKKGSSRKMAYCIDYQNQVKDDYFQLFNDDNWTLINKGVGWYYWQKAYTDKKPEIYTDNESLIGRNTRQIWLFLMILFIQFNGIRISIQRVTKSVNYFDIFLLSFLSIIVIVIVIVIIKFILVNRKLKKQDKL